MYTYPSDSECAHARFAGLIRTSVRRARIVGFDGIGDQPTAAGRRLKPRPVVRPFRPLSVAVSLMVMFGSGQFVISIDLEMSWGAVHHGHPHDNAPYRREREVVEDVLGLMAAYGMSATWATVGHLFLSECQGLSDDAHPDITPSYPWLAEEWYDLDPGSNLDSAPTWYGADLVDMIKACPVPQEIGSHSFAHIIAGDPACSREAFAADIAAAVAVAAEAGVELRSFVYPRNSIGHLGVLEEAEFLAYRGATPPSIRRSGLLGRIEAATQMIRPTATFRAEQHGSLVNIPHTYLFDPGSKNARRLGTAGWSRLVQRRLRHAIRTQSLFHLWFHSHNLAVDVDRAHTAMEDLFQLARTEIDRGRLVNLTMGDMARRMLAERVA